MGIRAGGWLAPLLVLAGGVWLLFAGSVATLTLLVVTDGGGGLGLLIGVGAVAFALLGPLMFWFVARKTWRAAHPRHLKGVEVTVDRVRVARGGGVSVSVAATGDAADLELGLQCRAHVDRLSHAGDSAPSRVTDVRVLWETWAPAAGGGLGARARLTVPSEQPYSWEGDCLSFAWSVAARRPGSARTSPPVPLWVEP